jgi:regulatory NSL complex subunit 3
VTLLLLFLYKNDLYLQFVTFRNGWTNVQRHLFNDVMKSFHQEHLARLAYEGNPSEPVLRRSSLDLTAQRVRQALTKICWDGKLTQWLHAVLIDNLSLEYLAIYLDVLQVNS